MLNILFRHCFQMQCDLHSLLEWADPSHLKDMGPTWYTSRREGARINEYAQYAGTSMKIKGNNQEMKSQNMPPLNSNTVLDYTEAKQKIPKQTVIQNTFIKPLDFPNLFLIQGMQEWMSFSLKASQTIWDDTCKLT